MPSTFSILAPRATRPYPFAFTLVAMLMVGTHGTLMLVAILLPSVYGVEILIAKSEIFATAFVLSCLAILDPSTYPLRLLRRLGFGVVTLVGGMSVLLVDEVRHGRPGAGVLEMLPILPAVAISLVLLGLLVPTQLVRRDRGEVGPGVGLRDPLP